MCGRAAQTHAAIHSAALKLLPPDNPNVKPPSSSSCSSSLPADSSWTDNLNMSPGHKALIFHKTTTSSTSSPTIMATPQTWGLITRNGTPSSPLPLGPTPHFQSKMFNARSETAAEKPSFRKLLQRQQSCILAVDGFYEWKVLTPDIVGSGGGSGKQPYFVHDQTKLPLLLAGLYHSVPTGRSEQDELRTFTILTTDACPKLTWLHSRQPLFVWDVDLAKKWILSPSPELLRDIATVARKSSPKELTWHPVTKRMSRVGYGEGDCMEKIQLEKVKSLKSFFAVKVKNETEEEIKGGDAKRRKVEDGPSSSEKKVKRGIASYFDKKSTDL